MADTSGNESTDKVHNVLPSSQTLQAAGDISVLDRQGKSHQFQDIYQGDDAAQNIMIIFIRHFYCTACQAYIHQIANSIKPDELASLSTSTSLVIVGCGSPDLIDFYADVTGWPFAIYTDPSNRIHDVFGFQKGITTMSDPGTYIQKSVPWLAIESMGQILGHLIGGFRVKYPGRPNVNGGEMFLQTVPKTENSSAESDEKQARIKEVTWYNRMRGSGDHAELPELREVLGLSEPEEPDGVDAAGWARALEERKGVKFDRNIKP